MAERKAHFAKVLSAAQLASEDAKKVADEATVRADEAERMQQKMQVGTDTCMYVRIYVCMYARMYASMYV
jgi:hypothetical protein